MVGDILADNNFTPNYFFSCGGEAMEDAANAIKTVEIIKV